MILVAYETLAGPIQVLKLKDLITMKRESGRPQDLVDIKALESAPMKVPEDLLITFKAKAKLSNTRYQTQIKALMRAWVLNNQLFPRFSRDPGRPTNPPAAEK